MASIRQTKKHQKRYGGDDFLGIGKKAKEKKAARQAAAANGIKQPTAAGKLLGSLGIGRNAKKNQSSGGGIAAHGVSIASNALNNSVQSAATTQEKKSFGESVQNVLEGVGGIARAGAGLVGAVRTATGGGVGSYEYEEGGVPDDGDYSGPGGGGAMDWLKKNWFIPVGVLVVGIGIYLFTRSNK